MKILFMGTPDFAAGALQAILDAGHEVTTAVTQPDKPKGRSGKLAASPVKELALAHDIPVLQPERIKRPEAVAELRNYEADVFVVAAYGQILSQEILDMPRYGSLNIHASLLPKYRGCSPIQHAILDGESETGVTIMQMNAGLDTGDMLYCKKIPIAADDTFETLHDKLMVLGGEAIVEALPLLEAGKLVPEPQDDQLSCYAPMIDKAMGRLDFTLDAAVLDRRIRGMTPWPGAYTFYQGKQLKIWKASPDAAEQGQSEAAVSVVPGMITEVTKQSVRVACGSGSLVVTELQLEGRKRMSTHDFLLGVQMRVGEMLINER